MSFIKKLGVKGYIGIEEQGLDAAKINIFKGPKGSGKSSMLEALETIFTNSKRRTEVIRHGEGEATLYVELDNGLEINRKIREGKADYLKIRKGDEGVPNTERYVRQFINGDIFRPLDWVNLSSDEQTKSILNMLQISWSNEDIEKWFGEIPSNIEYNQHILMVLKAIEVKYYKDRAEVNRQVDELKTQISVIKKDLPTDYDGEVWRDKKVQEYYNKVSDAQKVNQLIERSKALKEGFENKVMAIKANAESDKSRAQLAYKDKRQDIKDIIDLSKQKIEKSKAILEGADKNLEIAFKEAENKRNEKANKIDLDLQNDLKALEEEYRQKCSEAHDAHALRIKNIDAELSENKENLQELNKKAKETETENIHLQENKITQKTEELNSMDRLEKQELIAVDEKTNSEVEKEKIRVGKAGEYLQNNKPVDIEPLQKEADEVSAMREYLHQWDNMIDIRDNKLAEKQRESQILTARVEKARTLPTELLKTAQMPIEGISVDEKGLIRINGTLIDGLSDGEKLELAFKIAKAQCGDLKVICLDRFESLKSDQKKILETAMSDDYQYFITEHTDDSKMTIEKLGGNK